MTGLLGSVWAPDAYAVVYNGYDPTRKDPVYRLVKSVHLTYEEAFDAASPIEDVQPLYFDID